VNTDLRGIGMTSQRARDRLVLQIRKMGIDSERVLELIRTTPRHLFVDEALASRAYENNALPIGFGQTISQPYIVAAMTQALLGPGALDNVLEIGAGCGYQSVILSQLATTVYSVERIGALASKLRVRLHELRVNNVRVRHGEMLDFVMNLLIFFIITAVFTKEMSLDVNRPGAQGGPSSGKDTGSIMVNIQQNGEVWVDQRTVDVRAVRANVERLHAMKPDWGVLVIADENAEAGLLVLVVDQVRRGGVENITFGTATAK
jgi:protein-L-isoaspartate(D-aspartate) O-methyltransferase